VILTPFRRREREQGVLSGIDKIVTELLEKTLWDTVPRAKLKFFSEAAIYGKTGAGSEGACP